MEHFCLVIKGGLSKRPYGGGGGVVAVWVYNWRVYKPGWIGNPGAPLTNFNDGRGGGGSDRGSYFIPKKSQLQNLFTQKNHYFFSIPPKFP